MSGPPELTARSLTAELDALANPAYAEHAQSYFKTGPGEYGEGDVFIGLRMPQIREVAKAYRELPFNELERQLQSEIHEHRIAALVILSEQAKRAAKRSDGERQQALYEFYLSHTDRINNWDLVDVSCRDVVGRYLFELRDTAPLTRLAGSESIWERRIAMVSTWAFIREGELGPTFEIAEQLLGDSEDLSHKAIGWMLREAGKRDEAELELFLERFAATMPRTALRYAIERMPPERRAYWLSYGD